jgi:hypothetical protein
MGVRPLTPLIYLYGFVPAELNEAPRVLTGVSGTRVELFALDGINAVISEVDPAEFSQQHIEARLQDLTWVAARGAEHEAVVAWCVDQAQILPASLFTLYSSRAVLQRTAQEQEPLIKAELERLRDLREWDLKVSYNTEQLSAHAQQFSSTVREIEAEIAAASPGKRYLLERKRGEITKSEVSRVAREQANLLLADLRPLCAEAAVLPLPASRDQLPVVLHAALLVRRVAEADVIAMLHTKLDQYRDSGIEIAFSGPWAPYRFVQREPA